MRSETGTKFGEPSRVIFSTKAMMLFFGAVSFQEGRESSAKTGITKTARKIATTVLKADEFMVLVSLFLWKKQSGRISLRDPFLDPMSVSPHAGPFHEPLSKTYEGLLSPALSSSGGEGDVPCSGSWSQCMCKAK